MYFGAPISEEEKMGEDAWEQQMMEEDAWY
jgi:hypothetical protein